MVLLHVSDESLLVSMMLRFGSHPAVNANTLFCDSCGHLTTPYLLAIRWKRDTTLFWQQWSIVDLATRG